ncbi:MAG: branched-chain amino acid ABC transporter permease [Actinomycetota bacterium]
MGKSLKMMARPAAILAVLFLAATLPLGMGKFSVFLLAQTLVYAVAMFGLVVVVGLLGQPSLMHAEMMGVGAGVTAALVQGYHWNFWAAGLAAVAVGYFTGVIVGLPALRVRGLGLAIVTLAIAQTFDQLVLPSKFLQGHGGGRVISRPSLGPISLAGDHAFFEVALVVFVACLLLVLSIRRGKLGRMFKAIRESEKGAAASGVSLTRYKLLGFATSAGFAALAGVMSVGLTGSYTSAPYDWLHSMVFLAMLSIMGAATVSGAVVAAVVIIAVPQLLQQAKFLDQLTQFTSGLILIVQTIIAPQGAVPMVAAGFRALVHRLHRAGPGSTSDSPDTGDARHGAAPTQVGGDASGCVTSSEIGEAEEPGGILVTSGRRRR